MRLLFASAVAIVGSIICYAYGALFAYATALIFLDNGYSLDLAFAGSYYSVAGWAVGLIIGFVAGFEFAGGANWEWNIITSGA